MFASLTHTRAATPSAALALLGTAEGEKQVAAVEKRLAAMKTAALGADYAESWAVSATAVPSGV